MFDLVQEYNAPLPDLRLRARCQAIGQALFQAPSLSFPSVFPHPSELEATYRFMNNRRFDEQDIHTSHSDQTIRRAHQCERILAIHDSSEYRFPLHDESIVRQNLAKLSKENQGFISHHTLLASTDHSRKVLGHLRFQPFIHKKHVRDPQMQEFWESRGGLFENERHRWLEAVAETEALLEQTQVIHVMDSESDFYQMLAMLEEKNFHYILRHAGKRKCVDGTLTREGWNECESLLTREITLSKRTAKGKPKHKKEHPPRQTRQAKLSMHSRKLEIKKPNDVPKDVEKSDWQELRSSVSVNIIQIIELEPPEGEKAVEWLLFTSESIETIEDIVFVVDCYLLRWLIEEFFKAVKTGCAFSKRQEESASSLLKVLALSLPIAWFLLDLRTRANEDEKEDALEVLEEWELKLLKNLTKGYKWKRRKATVVDVLGALAFLGGSQRKKRIVGWMVLGRGYQRFLEHKKGAEAMLSLLES